MSGVILRAIDDRTVPDERDAPPIRGLGPGARLGRYELIAEVGRGGMAVVWAARLIGPRGFSKVVAVKTMLPALGADPRFEKMFLAEASFAATLKHRNVCEVLDLGEQDELLYLVMEWIQGDSLAALLPAHPRGLPCDVAARIALDVARGLDAAHAATDGAGASLDLVHRDVSPQNILIGFDGVAKIADFGVAKMGGGPATQAGFVKGKVRYMAPEQVYCEKVDRRTDVFALGVVLYEATTGKHPFAGPTDVATLATIAGVEEATPPSRVNPDYPPALERIVLRALAKDPAARFATMDEMAEALEGAIGEDVGAEEVGAVVRAASGSRAAALDSVIERSRSESTSEPPAAAIPAGPRAPAGSRVLLVAGLAAAIGLGIFAAVRSSKAPDPPRPEPAATAAPNPIPAPPETAAPAAPPAAPPTQPAEPAPSPSPPRSGRAPAPRATPSSASAAPAASSAPRAGVLETRE